ncbi:MAG: hypothetical protein LBT53_01945 [Puniceicoccales bacterium]|jgi:hypothetical protein|nr:hypothetical protein [Puniceicoccales bacterium]
MDIRNPIGLLFTILGVLLTGVGLFGGKEATAAKNVGADAININLWWGLVLIVFGGVMLGLALRAKAKTKED